MRIAVIGSGDMGGALARAFARMHDVTVTGSRPGSSSALKLVRESQGRIREMDGATAGRDADVIIFAVPWESVESALEALPLDGKLLVCVTVPYVEGADALAIGTTTSAAEFVASRAKGARVVQAFNTVSSTTVAAPAAHRTPATVIVSGDDAAAKEIVQGLARDIGFDVVDGGSLRAARYTEAMAMLWVTLAFDAGYGEDVAFRVLRSTPRPSAQD